MSSGLDIALIQTRTPATAREALAHVEPLIREAASGGAKFVLTPEGSNVLEQRRARRDAEIRGVLERRRARFELLRHDVTFPLYVECDEIYNLACPASPVHYYLDPVQTTKTSVHGAINMLGLAKRLRAKIMQASTSEIYGDPSVHPQPEEYWGNVNPIGPRGVYDEAKRFSEALTTAYRTSKGTDTGIVRIFNTYGPRMQPDDGRVVSNFIVQALAGERLTIYGEGNQTRSFCFVDDLVDVVDAVEGAAGGGYAGGTLKRGFPDVCRPAARGGAVV